MQADTAVENFRVWAADGVVYGPIDLPTLITWVKEERLTPGTWIYFESDGRWIQAGQMGELRMFLPSVPLADKLPAQTMPARHPSSVGIKPKALRRLRVFANMSDEQLERFLQYMEVCSVSPWNLIVKRGDPGDGMYFLLDGEVRVRLLIGGKETILTTLASGEFFGELTLFDQGPRSADVVANKESLLLRFPTAAFQTLVKTVPELATPFLMAIARTLTARVRADNRRLREAVKLLRAADDYLHV